MTVVLVFATVMLLCAAVPCVLFLRNLSAYLPPPEMAEGAKVGPVSVLIPARNEEANIGDAVEAVLRSEGLSGLEILVYDDGSTDGTAAVVERLAAQDGRVRLVRSTGLPAGWNGKQHACWRLAQEAGFPALLFLDADVRLAPQAVSRMLLFGEFSGAELVSGFPRQVTVTWMESMLLPLIHFVLLGFLPVRRMRRSARPAMSAGCGQFFLAGREAYFASGGHAALRESMHDGVRLPRLFKEHGFRVDLADLTELAHVRMYKSAGEVWRGLAKNATEGIGAPSRILPLTVLLLLGEVLPWAAAFCCAAMMVSVLLVGAEYDHPGMMAALFAEVFAAALCGLVPRLVAVRRFRQPLRSALLHPAGMLLLLSVQWYALARQVLGRPVGWRARRYVAGTGEQVG